MALVGESSNYEVPQDRLVTSDVSMIFMLSVRLESLGAAADIVFK